MPPSAITFVGLCAVAAVLGTAPVGTASGDDERWLGRPVTPAIEVLLVARGSDPRVQARWQAAVGHASPDIRATVARVIQMGGAVGLATAVDAQLAVESDVRAASEQAATVAAVTGRISDNAREASRRLGPPVAAAVAQALSRVAPTVLLSELASLRAHGADVDLALVDVLQRWLRTAPGHAARLQLALVRAGDEHAWRIVFKATASAGLPLPGGVMTTAIGSRRAAVPTLAIAHLLQLADEPFAAAVSDVGVRPALDVLISDGSQDAATRLGSALAAHRLGAALPSDWLRHASDTPSTDPLHRLGPSRIGGLSPLDRAALAAAWRVKAPSKQQVEALFDLGQPGATFIGDLPIALLQQVLHETRCHARYTSATVLIRYGADGRPATLVVSDDIKAACRAVVGALVSLMPGVPGEEVTAIVPLDPNTPPTFGVRPIAQPRYRPTDWNAPHPAEVGAQLVKFEEPTFGAVSLRHKLNDDILFDILIDEDGSVSWLRFRSTGHPELNTTAARSIQQMKFTPSTVAGRPVPTRAQFSYHFKL